MLSEISWTLFLTAIFVLLVMYYAFVAICYYPKEVLTFLLGRKNVLTPGGALQAAGPPREIFMGPVASQSPVENYLKRYQPASTDNVPTEATSRDGSVKIMDNIPDPEGEDFFMVASDLTDFPVIETISPKELSADSLLTTNVSDLMDAIRTLLRVIQDGEGCKSDVVSFFPSLLAQYPRVSTSKYRYSINQFIRDNCNNCLSEDMDLEEINDLWCFPYPPKAA